HVLPEEFYRLADESGMLVIADFPLTLSYAYHASPEEARFFETSVREQVPEMVRLLQNRPSILFWTGHDDPPWIAANTELADAHVAGVALAELPLAGGGRRSEVALRGFPAAGLGGARGRPSDRLPEPGRVRPGRPGVPGLPARVRDRPAAQAQVRTLLGSARLPAGGLLPRRRLRGRRQRPRRQGSTRGR